MRIPPEFVRATIAREGEAGREWVDRLPEIVGNLLRAWGLERDGDVRHGQTAIVVPVRRGTESLMLKVRWMDPWTLQEGRALEIWAGRGAVRLIDEEPDVGALLLERLDPDRSLLDAPEEEAVAVSAGLLRRLAVPAPADIRRIELEAAELIAEMPRLWERAGRPFRRVRLDRVCELAAELGTTDGRLLVNADLHYENVLAGTREPWLAIDPKVVAGDLEYAVAPLLWNRAEELATPKQLAARIDAIAEIAGLDVDRTRRWSIVRLVSVFLWSESIGHGRDVPTCRRLLGWLDRESI